MHQQHQWTDDDRRRIQLFLRTSARYLGLTPLAELADRSAGAIPARRSPWVPVREPPVGARRGVGL